LERFHRPNTQEIFLEVMEQLQLEKAKNKSKVDSSPFPNTSIRISVDSV